MSSFYIATIYPPRPKKILKQNTKKSHYAGLKNSIQRISLIMYKRPKVIEVKKARFFWDTWSEIQPVKIFKRRVRGT